jgi:excisionase family DNA binding protein
MEGQADLTRSTPYEDLPEYLTPEECRTYLALSRNGIYDLLRRGEIPHRRFGRIIRIPKTALLNGRSNSETAPSTKGGYER